MNLKPLLVVARTVFTINKMLSAGVGIVFAAHSLYSFFQKRRTKQTK